MKDYYKPIMLGSNIYHDYILLGKFSIYKNLFNENVTICPKRTISDINDYYKDNIEYSYDDNNILYINKYIDDKLIYLFTFYGWKQINDYELISKYEIIDPDAWIKTHSDINKQETMYFNNYNIGYSYTEIYGRKGNIKNNINILYDYCLYENETIFKDLFNKNISIDAISTIEQVKYYYPDVIYNYENNLIHIKRKSLNDWNTLLEKIFNFYGWYKKDMKRLYPKYNIIDLNEYIKEHK